MSDAEVQQSASRVTMIERIAIIVLLFALPALSIWSMQPPPPVPADAPPELFSAERAMRHVEAIAQAPHPTGSAENERVREYLFGVMQELGLEPRVESREYHWRGRDYTLHNLVGRLEGSGDDTERSSGGGGAVMLMAHYDSVRFGPGAADDAAGVAAILEAIRAIQAAGEPLHNDVIVLLTDGEEQNLLGARATVDQADWLKDVSVVLNFEARGTSGPSIMFEASANWWLIEQLAKTSHPIATSLAADIYKYMPNDTDFTVVADSHFDRNEHYHIYGLNFAFIEGASRYHTASDTPENLSRASLQHHGEYALHLTRDLGEAPAMPMIVHTGQRDGARPVFFPLPGAGLICYDGLIGMISLYLAAGVLGTPLIRFGTWRRIAYVLASLAAIAFSMAVAVGMTWALLRFLPLFHPHEHSLLPDEGQSVLYLLGFTGLALGVHLAVIGPAARQWDVRNVTVAAMCLSLVGAIAALAWVPGGTYLFIWPILAAGLALALYGVARKHPHLATAARLMGNVVVMSTTLLLHVPVIYMAALALSIRAGFIVVAVVMLALAMMSLPLQQLAPRRPWIAAAVAGSVAVVLLVVGAFVG